MKYYLSEELAILLLVELHSILPIATLWLLSKLKINLLSKLLLIFDV